MYGRRGDTQRSLRNHTCSFSPFDTGDNITRIVQTTENTGDVYTLCFLDLIHQLTNIVRNWVHTQGIKTTVQHVGLDTSLIKRLTKSTYGQIGILASHEVHLFESTAIGLNTGKATHIDDDWGDTLQLILTRLKLSRRLPHVAVDETKLNLLFHNE